MKYFDNIETLVNTTAKFQGYLVQCTECELIWVSYGILDFYSRMKNQMFLFSEEEWEILQKCEADLNEWGPFIEEIKEVGLSISHGVCTPCTREKESRLLREKQKKHGFDRCYATANDGSCTQDGTNGQPRCAYYSICVSGREELAKQEQRKRRKALVPLRLGSEGVQYA